jgi:branched-chain amino acid transport system ATP-binding protein
MLLQVKDLRVHYSKAEILKGVSLSVGRGETVALIGANGAGKTTTLRTISGLKEPTSGEMICNDTRIDGMAAQDIVKLGISHVPEGREVFAPMTVLDNLKLGAYLRKDRQGIANDLQRMYEYFPVLKNRRGQLAGSLSGGEQQMLAVARALMARPELLLMDEPSMGLAPMMVDIIADKIRRISAAGVGILLVEQNASMALALATRAYVLELGKITSSGDAHALAMDEHIKKAYLGG